MKERYIAPEADIICFAPAEHLASDYLSNYLNLIGVDEEINTPISGPDGTP